jgi:excisionase family DNA binding protein
MEVLETPKDTRDFTILEACAVLRITAPTVYKLMNQGDLASYKIGRSRRITFDSINRFRSGNHK